MTDARRETVTPDDSRPCVSREQCLAVLASHRALADRLAASEDAEREAVNTFTVEALAHNVTKQRLAEVERERDKNRELLMLSCRDNVEEFKTQCKPKCDSYGHEDDCPSAHPGLVYDELRKDLATAQATIAKHEAVLTLLHFIVEHDGDFGNPETVQAEAESNGLENVLKLKQQVARLREALEVLYDEQNDAPLFTTAISRRHDQGAG